MSNKDGSDAPEFFVSRRGRKVGLHEVDLGGIDIESDEKTPEASQQPPVPTASEKKKAVKAPRQKQSWSRKKTVFVFTILIAVAAVPVLLGEAIAAQYRGGTTSAKEDLSRLVKEKVLPAQQEATISADKIRSLATEVNDIVGSMCRGGMLDNAAGLYPRAKAAHDDCKSAQAGYAALTSALYALETQARYLERVDAILKPVAVPTTDEYAVINAQREAWKGAAEAIRKLSPPSAMQSAHQELSGHLDTLAATWAKLDDANVQQEADDFKEAEQQLSSEYEAVRGTGTQLAVILGDTQAKVTAAYNSLR